jgi:hypothetical protein
MAAKQKALPAQPAKVFAAVKAQKEVRPAPSCHVWPNQVNVPGVFMLVAELRRIRDDIVNLHHRPRARCNMTASLLVDYCQVRLDEAGEVQAAGGAR